MKKEDLQPLIGNYLNGFKIVKIEEDLFVKGQINLWTDAWEMDYFGDRSLVKFFVNSKSNSSQVYKELTDKTYRQLKHNWDLLKICLKDVMDSYDEDNKEDKDFIREILDMMQELEQGDSNE